MSDSAGNNVKLFQTVKPSNNVRSFVIVNTKIGFKWFHPKRNVFRGFVSLPCTTKYHTNIVAWNYCNTD